MNNTGESITLRVPSIKDIEFVPEAVIANKTAKVIVTVNDDGIVTYFAEERYSGTIHSGEV